MSQPASEGDRSGQVLIVLLLLLVLAAVIYSVVMNAKVASALQGAERQVGRGTDQLRRFADWLRI